jgi:hypothetical protein
MREDSSSDLFLNTELLWEMRLQSEGAFGSVPDPQDASENCPEAE